MNQISGVTQQQFAETWLLTVEDVEEANQFSIWMWFGLLQRLDSEG